MSNYYDQEYTREPQPGITPTTLSVRDDATGRRINAAPYYSEHFSMLRTYIASMSYVTGSHALKIGMNLSEGPRHEIARGQRGHDARSSAAPRRSRRSSPPRRATRASGCNADLGLYAQDQWTVEPPGP